MTEQKNQQPKLDIFMYLARQDHFNTSDCIFLSTRNFTGMAKKIKKPRKKSAEESSKAIEIRELTIKAVISPPPPKQKK